MSNEILTEEELQRILHTNYVQLNDNNIIKGPHSHEVTHVAEISPEAKAKIAITPYLHVWKYIDKDTVELVWMNEEAELDYYRDLRETDCFPIINRGTAWYNSLTEEQKIELDAWYQAWLDVTETKVIPEKPTWLK